MSDNEQQITLGVLTSIYDNSRVTQRSISGELGIALGLTNFHLKRCVKKGLVKVKQIPANRYAYYLTPRGFSEKSRLAHEYFTQGFKFFRLARSQCMDIFSLCVSRHWNRIALHGLTDLSEIAVMCSKSHKIELNAIIDRSTKLTEYSGIPVFDKVSDHCLYDAIMITDLGSPKYEFDKLTRIMGPDRVFAPEILNISPNLSLLADVKRK